MTSGESRRPAPTPMAARLQRQQARPSLLRAYAWRALQNAARSLPEPDLGVTDLSLTLPHLPRRLDGLTILHITDLHLTWGDHPALTLPELLANVQCDLTVYTGDMVEDEAGLKALPPLLQAMKPRTAAFAVLGNHDHYHYRHETGEGPLAVDLTPLLETLAAASIDVLDNENRVLFDGGLHIVGVDDPALGRDDLTAAFGGVDPGSPTLLLAHSPDILLRLDPYKPGLVLAGHTHGGQLRLPGLGPLGSVSVLPRRYSMGVYTYNGVQTYVSRGVGTSGAPARLYCPPEVAVITLRSPFVAGDD